MIWYSCEEAKAKYSVEQWTMALNAFGLHYLDWKSHLSLPRQWSVAGSCPHWTLWSALRANGGICWVSVRYVSFLVLAVYEYAICKEKDRQRWLATCAVCMCVTNQEHLLHPWKVECRMKDTLILSLPNKDDGNGAGMEESPWLCLVQLTRVHGGGHSECVCCVCVVCVYCKGMCVCAVREINKEAFFVFAGLIVLVSGG